MARGTFAVLISIGEIGSFGSAESGRNRGSGVEATLELCPENRGFVKMEDLVASKEVVADIAFARFVVIRVCEFPREVDPCDEFWQEGVMLLEFW